MDIKVNYEDLNMFQNAAGIEMTLHGLSENSLELTYNPGTLFPNITFK